MTFPTASAPFYAVSRWIVASVAILLFAALSVQAELVGVQRFKCVFDRHVSPDTNGVSRSETMRFLFVVDGMGNAYAIGTFVEPVRLVVGYQGVTFLEELATGAVQSTTIHKNGRAVHSRHTMLSFADEIVPGQFYGTCLYEQE